MHIYFIIKMFNFYYVNFKILVLINMIFPIPRLGM